MSFYKLYQCPLGLMPHCYVMHQQSSSSVVINVSMPSRASTSLLLKAMILLCQKVMRVNALSGQYLIATVKSASMLMTKQALCVNALSGQYLIATAKLECTSVKYHFGVNALSGQYLIATGIDINTSDCGTVVSMPSRASTSLLLEDFVEFIDNLYCVNALSGQYLIATTDMINEEEKEVLKLCQCPLGLVPHCYMIAARTNFASSLGVNALSGQYLIATLPGYQKVSHLTSRCQCPLGLVPHCYGVMVRALKDKKTCVNALSGQYLIATHFSEALRICALLCQCPLGLVPHCYVQ